MSGNANSVRFKFACNVHDWACFEKLSVSGKTECLHKVAYDLGQDISFIIYLQKIPLDTTYFPTQKYKAPYHATKMIFSVSPSYIFYPPRKNPAPDGGLQDTRNFI